MKHAILETPVTAAEPAAELAPEPATVPAAARTQAPPRRFNDLPGPSPWPVVGNAFQVSLHRMHQNMEAWVKAHGPLMQVRLAGFHVMVVADTDLIGQLLRERPETFRRPSRMQAIMREMGIPDGVFVAEGEHWARQRRMVMASFAPQQVRTYFPALLNVAHRLRARWLHTSASATKRSQDIDLQADLMRFTVDAISGLAFGVDVNTLQSNDDVIQRHLDKIFPTIWRRAHALVPYWQVVKLPRDRALDESMRVVNGAIRDFMAQARVRLQAPQRRAAPQNLLEAMLVAADAPDSGMSDEDVAGNVFTMLLAGEDTTATSLSWMIEQLWRNPVALARAREEVGRVLATPEGPLPMAQWTPEHLAQLDWLEACIHESMRLKPVGPFNLVEALKDTEVAGVPIRAGTPVLLVMRHDTVRDEVFPQAERFLPERWLPEAEHLAPASAKRVSMPFGAGPRICPGRFLAMLEIKLAAAMLLQTFDITAVDTPDGRPAQEHMALTMVPVGLKMRVRPRTAPLTA
jgi:cytochrome P450